MENSDTQNDYFFYGNCKFLSKDYSLSAYNNPKSFYNEGLIFVSAAVSIPFIIGAGIYCPASNKLNISIFALLFLSNDILLRKSLGLMLNDTVWEELFIFSECLDQNFKSFLGLATPDQGSEVDL